MPYYVSGYGDFLANQIYFVLLLPILALSIWAQYQVSRNYRRYDVSNHRHLTGAQAAEAVLRAHGVYNVAIRTTPGRLTDHYDPRDNAIYLSSSVYGSDSISAVGVAAHEAGHAVQYAQDYKPVRLRSAIVPATQLGSRCSFLLLLAGLILYSQPLFFVGIVLFSFTTFFQLVTLPVEFDASRRAIETIDGQGLLEGSELTGAKRVLRAAALTYVAALLMSVLELLRYVLVFLGRSNEDS